MSKKRTFAKEGPLQSEMFYQQIHCLLDNLLYGLIESVKVRRSGVASTGVGTSPEAVLSQIESLFKEAFEKDGKVDVSLLESILLRMLAVRSDTPLRDKYARPLSNSVLTKLRLLALWLLQTVLGLCEAVSSRVAVSKLFLGELAPWLCLLFKEDQSAEVTNGLFCLAKELACFPGVYDSLLCPFSEKMVTIFIQLAKSFDPVKRDPTKVGSIFDDEGKHPSGGKRQKQEKPVKEEGRDVSPALAWLAVMGSSPSFQLMLTSTRLRSPLVSALVSLLDKPGAYMALSALVLGHQPAYLSPDLPLFMRITAALIHCKENGLLARNAALQIDLVVRARRPFPPQFASSKVEHVMATEPEEPVSMNAPITTKPGFNESVPGVQPKAVTDEDPVHDKVAQTREPVEVHRVRAQQIKEHLSVKTEEHIAIEKEAFTDLPELIDDGPDPEDLI